MARTAVVRTRSADEPDGENDPRQINRQGRGATDLEALSGDVAALTGQAHDRESDRQSGKSEDDA